MTLLKVFLLFWMFNEVILESDARIPCPKGHKVSQHGNTCVSCNPGSYMDKENDSKYCNPCTPCYQNSGSRVEQECTKVSDTKCECREGFVPLEDDRSICKCKNGFELKQGVCSECEEGHFSPSPNTPCKKWKDCKSTGVKTKGTKTSDVTCNDVVKSNSATAPPHTSKNFYSLLSSTTQRPPEGAQTLQMQTAVAAIITAASPPAALTGKALPPNPSSAGSHIGIALLMVGIIGLLVLTVMTCKLHITPCWQKKTTVPKQDSLCGRPVEESGDDSSSSLKLNPGEP
ncbi:tumor necrosis factor receptor superfamily member 4 isoform X2 [Stegastes partitus]|uniref:TNF receptor superfamily member 4 n=1 Tax=Stegastes partitus TaxID=144197 RepID=A0A3B4ZIT8_9TELE|nr:PREDICTED: tumor necrosis factor receptor superfamily member 4 isoform X2 [Stegastes partitus]